MANTILNGLKHELTATNMDVKYHQLWSNVKSQSLLWIKFERDRTHSISSNQTLVQFEFKIFIYSYFLNRLLIDDVDKFKDFGRVCLSQLSQEMEELVLRAEESSTFNLPGHFHRDDQYLLEKIQYFMEDIDAFTKKRAFPKYTQVSILIKPLDNSQEVFFSTQSATELPNFLPEYESVLNALNQRYNYTPGVKSQEEKEKDSLTFANIPKGTALIDPNGIDNYIFGNSTDQIKAILGLPDENPKYSGSIDEFLSYKKIGISFGFKNNALVVINIYSGRPEGFGETKFQKYNFKDNIHFTMDSYYEDIIRLFGAPVEENDFPKAKIPCKSLNYGRFNFSFYTSNNQLYYFQYKSENFNLNASKSANLNTSEKDSKVKFIPWEEFEGFRYPMSIEEVINFIGLYDTKRSSGDFIWLKYFSKGVELCFESNQLISIQLYFETSGEVEHWESYSFKIKRDISTNSDERDITAKYGQTKRDYFGKNDIWQFSLRYPGISFHFNEKTNKIVAVYLYLDPTPHDSPY